METLAFAVHCAQVSQVSRRQFLACATIASVASVVRLPRAWGIGAHSRFRIGHLQLGASANVRENALKRLAWEIEKRTAVTVALEPVAVTLTSASLAQTPFVFLTGDREFELPNEAQLAALRRFLTFGGFLFIDSAQPGSGTSYDAAVRRLVDALYPAPAKGLALLPQDHVIYKSFYLLDRPYGRVITAPALEAVVKDNRVTVVYVANDAAGAWMRDDLGNYLLPCEPGGERQRELAFRLGVNVVMYALCLDYKTDQVHVPYILKRRRWRPQDGASEPARPPAPVSVPSSGK